MIDCDVAIIIYSRNREAYLSRLLRDLTVDFVPCLNAGGLTCCTFVYAQGYPDRFLRQLGDAIGTATGANRFLITPASGSHARIGDVAHTAIGIVHERSSYKLAMLMDDDSTYAHDAQVALNLREASRGFIDGRRRAYSIKLGDGDSLRYEPFVDLASPIMPFREKMLWASRDVLDEVLALPRFSELSIGEDAVIAAVAWLADPEACFGVHGIATFLHLGFEGPEERPGAGIGGGYAELMGYTGSPPARPADSKYDEALRTGVTPYHVLPRVFVPEEHPHFQFNGVREEVVLRMRSECGASTSMRDLERRHATRPAAT